MLDNAMPGGADLAALMSGGSLTRLLWGVLPAAFSVVLYLSAACGVYRLRPGALSHP